MLVGVFVGSRWDSHRMRRPARMLGYFSPLRRRGAEDSVGGQVWDLSPQPRRKPHRLDLGRDLGDAFAPRTEQAFVVPLNRDAIRRGAADPVLQRAEDRQRAAHRRFRLPQPVGVLQQLREVVESGRDVRMRVAVSGLGDRRSAALERLSAGV
jgi:hypothetical protein